MRRLPIYLAFVFSGLLLSCSGGDELPEGILPDTTMRNLIIEFNLAETASEQSLFDPDVPDFKAELYYEAALKKQGISRETFIRSLNYYSDKPERLNRLLEDAITELSKRQIRKNK